MPDYDIAKAFQEIEKELILSMRRNLSKHIDDQELEGFDWTMWQAEQLNELTRFRKNNKALFGNYFSTINTNIESTLKAAQQTGRLKQEQTILKALQKGYVAPKRNPKGIQGSFFKLNDNKMNALVSATMKDMTHAETAVLRMTNDVYRRTIFKAATYANSGAGTVNQAIDMATKDFLAAGINCIEYANGRRVNIASYAEMALRTSNKRAYLVGEGAARDAWGVHLVRVSQYGACSPTCLPWQGRIYIDDVYSGGKADGNHPLLSEAIAGGLFHPNCRHTMSTWFDGINIDGAGKDTDTVNKNYALEQKQRYNERQIRRYKRLSEGNLDPDNVTYYKGKVGQWQMKQSALMDAYPDILRRDYAREGTRGLTLKTKNYIPNPILAQKRALSSALAVAKQALTNADTRTVLSGVWKDDVIVSDYLVKKVSIQAKKDYYINQIQSGTLDAGKKQEFTDKYNKLLDWEQEGIDYEDAKLKVDDLESQLSALSGPSKFVAGNPNPDDPYTDERKNKAHWFKDWAKADAELKPDADAVYKVSSQGAKDGLYDYTAGSGGFNRPLAGFRKPWNQSGSGWEQKYYVGPDKVWIDFEGKGQKIRDLTEMINQSSYDFDIWLQRGCDSNAFDLFLGTTDMASMTEVELQQFVGRSNTFDNFLSCATNKGSGFSHKPVIVNVYAPKGTKMMYARPWSAFTNEDEIIIQRGATYKIKKIEKNGGKIYMDVEVRPEKGYNTFQQDPNEWTGSKKDYHD
ncbi:ADP-ribosyltransferase exoenzyme [Eubacterium aggregans]|uniref:ADP-ribosyltransferase exoenzyme n=1 Tax=Eubacterium aggregans TaxID=81409 RepID=A0A1H3Y2D6_9FIRM|nr:phage minor capsid protein [Eubacterium aggregans]SEA05743.1 ADP-ribosyltransferase exoenzyme [Eubacterium aggregans]